MKDTELAGCYNIFMHICDNNAIDRQFSKLLEAVEDNDLREAMRQRLRRNTHLVVGVILVDKDGRICLVQEAKDAWAGKWNIPIGHLEHCEKIPDGAKRETKEESGYDVDLIELLPLRNVINRASHRASLRVVYVGKIVGGAPEERDHDDTSDVKWFAVSEIEQMAKTGGLRSQSILSDLELYQSGVRIPLEAIIDVEQEV